MQLEIKKTTVTRDAEVITSNATYKITYTIVGDSLQNVTAHVCDCREVEVPGPNGSIKQSQTYEIGALVMEGGIMRSGQFPYSEKLPLYMSDFVGIVNEIVEPAESSSKE